MDGLWLPEELRVLLAQLGLTWPEALELAVVERGLAWHQFAFGAAPDAAAARSAVGTVLATNHSDGLDAFAAYVDRVTGVRGYAVRSLLAAAGCGVGLMYVGWLVLSFKLMTITALAALAVAVAAGAALAVETAGVSVWPRPSSPPTSTARSWPRSTSCSGCSISTPDPPPRRSAS